MRNSYGPAGRQLSETGPRGTVSSHYDLAGRRTRLIWPDGFFVGYDHFVTGELSAVRENGASSGPGVLATFGYDDQGRRISLARGNGTSTSYGYDPASRLASLGHDLAGAVDDVTLTFGYNPAGQIVANSRSNDAYAWTFHGAGSTVTTTDGLNRAVAVGAAAVSHDAKGNMTADGQDRQFSYSSENLFVRNTRLSTGAYSETFYDPLLRFDASTSNCGSARHCWVGDGHDLVGEYSPSGIYRRYVHIDGDEPLAQVETSSGARTWLHADERGSIITISNPDGTLWGINPYDEFGRGHPLGNYYRFQFAGQPMMMRGLQYHRARIYDLNGRFVQPDPIGLAAGLNLYTYPTDPVNRTDPSGMLDCGLQSNRRSGNCANDAVKAEIRKLGLSDSDARFFSSQVLDHLHGRTSHENLVSNVLTRDYMNALIARTSTIKLTSGGLWDWKLEHDAIVDAVAAGVEAFGGRVTREVTFSYLGFKARFDLVSSVGGIPISVLEIKTTGDTWTSGFDLLRRYQPLVMQGIMNGRAIPLGQNAIDAGFEVNRQIGRPFPFAIIPGYFPGRKGR